MRFTFIAEIFYKITAQGSNGSVDEKIREIAGGGAAGDINAYKRAAKSLQEEASSCPHEPSKLLINIWKAEMGHYIEMGRKGAEEELEEKEARLRLSTEEHARLQEAHNVLIKENALLEDSWAKAKIEKAELVARQEEREKAAEKRISELLSTVEELRKSQEKTTGRLANQELTNQEQTRQLERTKEELLKRSKDNHKLIDDLATTKDAMTNFRIQHEADQTRIREYQKELSSRDAKEGSLIEENRRLNHELRVSDRQGAEAMQRGTSLQMENEHLRGQLETLKKGGDPGPKRNKRSTSSQPSQRDDKDNRKIP